MLKICEDYAEEHNLVFSMDPVPSKSKTKCLLFSGKASRVVYPEPLVLNGKPLPWVKTAEHLGHTLDQTVSMEKDCKRAKAKYISRSMDVRQQLSFASPEIVLKAIQVFSSDLYGCMLWDLSSDAAESLFKCWNTNVKLTFGIPRSTFTYLIEGHFAATFPSLRNQVLCRYGSFYQGLLKSPSKEVQFLARILAKDPRSTTYKNLRLLTEKTKLEEPYMYNSDRLKSCLPNLLVPENELWRLGLIDNLLVVRKERTLNFLPIQRVCEMLDSLCNS